LSGVVAMATAAAAAAAGHVTHPASAAD